MMRMGHGDEIVLADANFPSDSIAAHTVYGKAVSMTGAGVPDLLRDALRLMPLDEAVDKPVACMGAPPGAGAQPIHERIRGILDAAGYGGDKTEMLARHDFYARARGAFAIVRTSETARFGNMLLKKGVVTPQA